MMKVAKNKCSCLALRVQICSFALLRSHQSHLNLGLNKREGVGEGGEGEDEEPGKSLSDGVTEMMAADKGNDFAKKQI